MRSYPAATHPATTAPKALTDPILAAADWVIVFGAHELGPMGEGIHCQSWPAPPALGTGPGSWFVAELETRIRALWLEITAGTGPDPGSGPA